MAHYIFDGCDTIELAKKYGTPLYVVSESKIRERLCELKTSFMEKYPNTLALFASKALQTIDILKIVNSEGIGLDVVSDGELYAAKKAGFPMDKIYFHGNTKSPADIKMAVEYGVGHVVVDNLDELNLLNSESIKAGKKTKILFRITPGVDSHTHEKISTAKLDSKFGIPLDKRVRDNYIGAALQMEGIELQGFHFHVGSQLLENSSHLLALGILLNFVKEVKAEYGFSVKELNLGGGFGVHYCGNETTTKVSMFVDPMMEEIKKFFLVNKMTVPKIIIEPGRWVVGEAGITLYTVTSKKEIPGIKTFIGVDGGMPDNPRPSLYNAVYEAIVADRADAACNECVTVAGKCCESGDIIVKDIMLASPKAGDTLAVFTTGAYNHSMASNYNRLRRPAMVLTNKGTDKLSVRRETYEDLIAREI